MAASAFVSSGLLAPPVGSPGPGPTPVPAPRPARLLIPSLGLDATVEEVGLDAVGAMGTPHFIWNVGWFNSGPAPGAAGDAVIDGHHGLPGQPLIFNGLGQLPVGGLITVVGADGSRRDFAVTSSMSWPADSHPAGLFETAGAARLTLITCDGAYFRGSQTYADRLVVEASLLGSGG